MRRASKSDCDTDRVALGQQARAPRDIPLRGWWLIVKRVAREFTRHDMSITAAGISFLALFGVFSAIASFVAFYGLFANPQSVVKSMSALRGFVPADALVTTIGQMGKVTKESGSTLVAAGIFSLVVSLWSAQQGAAALMIALNTAYREKMPHGPWQHLLKSLFMSIEVILGLLLTAVLVIGLPLFVQDYSSRSWVPELVRAAGMALGGLVLFLGLVALYRWVPDRRPPRWRWVGSGAALVVGFWTVASILFSVFLSYSNSYTAIYGSLSAVVILLTLMYVTVITVLVGAEFNAQLEYHTLYDTTTDDDRPLGERGAWVADHVAEEVKKK